MVQPTPLSPAPTHMCQTVLDSTGSAVNKTVMVTVLMLLEVSQKDMHLTNKDHSLMTSISVWYVQRGGSSDLGGKGGEVHWRGSWGEAKEGFPEEVRLQLRLLVRRQEWGLALALRVDPRVLGELESRLKQRLCFTSFVITQTSSKGALKKRENGFRSCYFLPPSAGNWTE